MQEEFNELGRSFGYPSDYSAEMIDELYEERGAMEIAFEETFGKYRTGGDLNLVELYAKV